jgi:hypothetical protein
MLATALLNQNVKAEPEKIAIGGELVWEKTFGGSGDDRAFYATATGNGTMIVGSTRSIIADQTVAWVLSIDDEGNMVWNKTYPCGYGSEFRYIINLVDGFLFVGNQFSSSVDTNGFAVRTDWEGNMIWNLTLGGENVDRLFGAAKGQDGFLLAGLTQTADNDGNSQVWLIKVDEDGKVLWNKTYGWTMDDAARAVAVTDDGSFIVVGYTNSMGQGNYDFLALKVDGNGNFLWNQTYGGTESDKAYAITPATNGFVIAGDTRSQGAGESDALIIKIDAQGTKLWERTFGGNGFDVPTYISALKSGEGFVVGGITFSYGNGYRDFWIFRLDNSGNLRQSCTVGRGNYEESYAAVEVSEDNFVMAGWTNSIGQGAYDFYVLKVKVVNNIEWWQTNVFIAALLGSIAFLVVGLLFLRWRSNQKRK